MLRSHELCQRHSHDLPRRRAGGRALVPHAWLVGKCLLASIATGARLALLEAAPRRDASGEVPFAARAARVFELIQTERVTILPAVPYTYAALAPTPGDVPADLSSLRLCLSGGSPLPEPIFEQFVRRFGIPIRQVYGSTETGFVAINLAPYPEQFDYASVGWATGDAVIRVTDGTSAQELPCEHGGEIAIQTPAMATSYLGLPELSRAAFRDGFFFTGDLGRKDQDGYLYLTGRKKILIDSGGEKVDPSEIEDVLKTHPAVADAVVIGVPTPFGGEAIKAVIVPGASSITELDLLRFCHERLADFKIPRLVEFRAELPKSPMGKLLRKDLIGDEPWSGRQGPRGALRASLLSSAPRSWRATLELELRKHLAGMLQLDLADVDPRRPLAELGVSSLMVLELRAWLEETLELPLALTVLWSYPTVAALADHLVAKLAAAQPVHAPLPVDAGSALPPVAELDELESRS